MSDLNSLYKRKIELEEQQKEIMKELEHVNDELEDITVNIMFTRTQGMEVVNN